MSGRPLSRAGTCWEPEGAESEATWPPLCVAETSRAPTLPDSLHAQKRGPLAAVMAREVGRDQAESENSPEHGGCKWEAPLWEPEGGGADGQGRVPAQAPRGTMLPSEASRGRRPTQSWSWRTPEGLPEQLHKHPPGILVQNLHSGVFRLNLVWRCVLFNPHNF